MGDGAFVAFAVVTPTEHPVGFGNRRWSDGKVFSRIWRQCGEVCRGNIACGRNHTRAFYFDRARNDIDGSLERNIHLLGGNGHFIGFLGIERNGARDFIARDFELEICAFCSNHLHIARKSPLHLGIFSDGCIEPSRTFFL